MAVSCRNRHAALALVATIGLVAAIGVIAADSAFGADKPNIVVIYADDLSYGDVLSRIDQAGGIDASTS